MKLIFPLLLTVGLTYGQEPRFSADVHLVMVDAQVTEKETGRIVELLGPKDFEIFDKGKAREVREFHFETTPLDVVFLVYGKNGWGSARMINDFHKGLYDAVRELKSGDRAAILRTDSESAVDLHLTDDLKKAQHVIIWGSDQRYKTGYDHLYDAVQTSTTLFSRPKDRSRRNAIVAITDDIERGSRIKIDPLITSVLEADTTLNEVVCVFGKHSHEVGFGGVWGIPRVTRQIGGSREGDSLLDVVEASGGEAVPGDRFSEQLPEVMRRLRMRYLLGFYAEPTQLREFHPLEVRLTTEAVKRYPNMISRARRGYYTESSGSGQVSEAKQ
jgi:VWFA-related protein